jgi:CheY-like chemotaxis protein
MGQADQVKVFNSASALQNYLTSLAGLSDLPKKVVTDLRMPVIDGFELIRWIRSQPQCAPVELTVLSNSNFPKDQERATSLGAKHYLQKPADINELKKMLSLVLDLQPS